MNWKSSKFIGGILLLLLISKTSLSLDFTPTPDGEVGDDGSVLIDHTTGDAYCSQIPPMSLQFPAMSTPVDVSCGLVSINYGDICIDVPTPGAILCADATGYSPLPPIPFTCTDGILCSGTGTTTTTVTNTTTNTNTGTNTTTITNSGTNTVTNTNTSTQTATNTTTVTNTVTNTVSGTNTTTVTNTTTATFTESGSGTNTVTATVSGTGSLSGTSSGTSSAVSTASVTWTNFESETWTASATQTETGSMTTSVSETGTYLGSWWGTQPAACAWPGGIATVTITGTATATTTQGGTGTITATETATVLVLGSATAVTTAVFSYTLTGAQTYYQTSTDTTTATMSFTGLTGETDIGLGVGTATSTEATATGTASGTWTRTETSVATGTWTYTGTQTETGTALPTSTETGTATASGTATATQTYTYTATLTQSGTSTGTTTVTVTLTGTATLTSIGTSTMTQTGGPVDLRGNITAGISATVQVTEASGLNVRETTGTNTTTNTIARIGKNVEIDTPGLVKRPSAACESDEMLTTTTDPRQGICTEIPINSHVAVLPNATKTFTTTLTISKPDLGTATPTASAIPIAGSATAIGTGVDYGLNGWVTHASEDAFATHSHSSTATGTVYSGGEVVFYTGTGTGTKTSTWTDTVSNWTPDMNVVIKSRSVVAILCGSTMICGGKTDSTTSTVTTTGSGITFYATATQPVSINVLSNGIHLAELSSTLTNTTTTLSTVTALTVNLLASTKYHLRAYLPMYSECSEGYDSGTKIRLAGTATFDRSAVAVNYTLSGRGGVLASSFADLVQLYTAEAIGSTYSGAGYTVGTDCAWNVMWTIDGTVVSATSGTIVVQFAASTINGYGEGARLLAGAYLEILEQMP